MGYGISDAANEQESCGWGGAVSVGLTEAVEGMEIFVCKFDGSKNFVQKGGITSAAAGDSLAELATGKA
jgi:hypothetical protein